MKSIDREQIQRVFVLKLLYGLMLWSLPTRPKNQLLLTDTVLLVQWTSHVSDVFSLLFSFFFYHFHFVNFAYFEFNKDKYIISVQVSTVAVAVEYIVVYFNTFFFYSSPLLFFFGRKCIILNLYNTYSELYTLYIFWKQREKVSV